MRLRISRFALFALPCWKKKAIDDAGFPDVSIACGRELARIAGVDAHLVREVVVEPKVGALRIAGRQTIGRVRTVAKSLLHAEDWLKPADCAVGSAEMRETIICLDPIALGVLSMCVLRTKLERTIQRFPPDVKSRKVLVRSLKQAPIGGSDFETRIGEEDRSPPSAGALRIELRIGAGRGEISCIVDRKLLRRHGGSAQHAADTGVRTHGAEWKNERAIGKVANPYRREALVVGPERREEFTADDRQMPGSQIIALQKREVQKRRTGVTDLAAAFGEERFDQRGAAFHQQVRPDGRGEQRRKDGEIRCVSPICDGDKADSARDQWCVLRRGIVRNEICGCKKHNSAESAPDSRGQITRRVTHGSMLKEPLPWGVNALSCDCQVFVILASSSHSRWPPALSPVSSIVSCCARIQVTTNP